MDNFTTESKNHMIATWRDCLTVLNDSDVSSESITTNKAHLQMLKDSQWFLDAITDDDLADLNAALDS